MLPKRHPFLVTALIHPDLTTRRALRHFIEQDCIEKPNGTADVLRDPIQRKCRSAGFRKGIPGAEVTDDASRFLPWNRKIQTPVDVAAGRRP